MEESTFSNTGALSDKLIMAKQKSPEEEDGDSSSLSSIENCSVVTKKKQKIRPAIVPQEEAPKWLIYNHFMTEGYRINYFRVKHLLKSIMQWHNETMNIWTHLIALFVFLYFTVYTFFRFDPTYYEFLKYRVDISEVSWSAYSAAPEYPQLRGLLDSLILERDFQNFEKMSSLWDQNPKIFNGKDTSLKAHTLGDAFPEYFDLPQFISKIGEAMFHEFFELVSPIFQISNFRPIFPTPNFCIPKSRFCFSRAVQ